MEKLNKGYVSVFNYLLDAEFPLAYEVYRAFFYRDSLKAVNAPFKLPPHFNPQTRRGGWFTGAFQPLADMVKDFSDTFKPYKAKRYYIKRELLQPLRGLGNIARGVGIIVAVPFIFAFSFFKSLYCAATWESFKQQENFKGLNVSSRTGFVTNFLLVSLMRTVIWSIDSLCSLIRGATQIATAPLTWAVKIPVRLTLTAAKPIVMLEDNSGMERLLELEKSYISGDRENKKDDNVYKLIPYEFTRKALKAQRRGQQTLLTFNYNRLGVEPIRITDEIRNKVLKPAP